MMELNKRDKTVLTTGAVFLVIFCAFQFIYLPAADKLNLLKRQLLTQDDAIAQMKDMAGAYRNDSLKFDQQKLFLKNRPKNFTLFSLLDVLAEKSGVKTNVVYMKPVSQDIENQNYRISKVKVKLGNVYLKGLIDFLSSIESSKNGVVITSLSLTKTGKNADRLDAVLDTQTLVSKGDA